MHFLKYVLFMVSMIHFALGAPPEFINNPRSDSTSTSIKGGVEFCGDTGVETDTYSWQLYNKETERFDTVAFGPCLVVPNGLGITEVEQLGETQSVTYRICASNVDGTTCYRDSHYAVSPDA